MVRLRVASSKFACACTVVPVIWHMKRKKLLPEGTVYVACCCTHDNVVTLFGVAARYVALALLISVTSITHRALPSPLLVSTRYAHPHKLITSPGFTGIYCDVPLSTAMKLSWVLGGVTVNCA